jgi:hypothetical protein
MANGTLPVLVRSSFSDIGQLSTFSFFLTGKLALAPLLLESGLSLFFRGIVFSVCEYECLGS